jgi:hypothetical protein
MLFLNSYKGFFDLRLILRAEQDLMYVFPRVQMTQAWIQCSTITLGASISSMFDDRFRSEPTQHWLRNDLACK